MGLPIRYLSLVLLNTFLVSASLTPSPHRLYDKIERSKVRFHPSRCMYKKVAGAKKKICVSQRRNDDRFDLVLTKVSKMGSKKNLRTVPNEEESVIECQLRQSRSSFGVISSTS